MAIDPRLQRFFSTIQGDAAWMLHELELATNRALFIEVSEQTYHDSAFLDGRIAAKDPRTAMAPLSGLAQYPGADEPDPWAIFHISHCGSTLYSQILPRLGNLLPLREPMPLRDLAAMERERGKPYSYLSDANTDALQQTVWRLFARRFHDAQRALIKATSDCGVLAGRFLSCFEDARALLVHLPLEPFLATMLRSDLRRQETAHFCQSRLSDLHRLLNDDDIRLYELGEGERTAMSWLSNLLAFEQLKPQDEQIRWVNFDHLVRSPVEHVSELARSLGLNANENDVDQAIRECTRTYAKDASIAYGFEARERELEHGRKTAADDIRAGIRWVERQLKSLPESERLSSLIP